MKGRLIRALGVGAALLLPLGGAAFLGAGTAGASNPSGNAKSHFTFSTSGNTTHGTATCATQTIKATMTCTTTSSSGTTPAHLKTFTKTTETTGSRPHLKLTNAKFELKYDGTTCTIKLSGIDLTTYTSTAKTFTGTATIASPTITGGTHCTSTLKTFITHGKFTATITF